MATKGYAAPEVGKAYARARELCRQVGETQIFPVLWGLWTFHYVRAEHQTACELGEQCLALAQNMQDPASLVAAHYALLCSLHYLGELVPAQKHAEQGITLYEPQQHRSLAFLGLHDPGMGCLAVMAWTLWNLGYPDQALKKSDEALALAQQLSHPFSLAAALDFTAILHHLRREGQAAGERAEDAITLSIEQGFPFWAALGTFLRGWALAEQGQAEEGITQIRQAIAAWRATGAELSQSRYLALLAEVYGKVGRIEEGLTVLAEARAMVERSGARFYEAELYRLYGELSLRIGEPETGRTGDRRGGFSFPDSPIPRFFSRGVFSEGH